MQDLRGGTLAAVAENDPHTHLRQDLERGSGVLRSPGQGHHVQQAPGDELRFIGMHEAGAEHHELIPAQAGHHVVRPEGPLHAPCQGNQQLITHGMAVDVIDLLETIEVAEQNRQPARLVLQLIQGCVEGLQQPTSIGQAGHRTGDHLCSQRQLLIEQLLGAQPQLLQRHPGAHILETKHVGHGLLGEHRAPLDLDHLQRLSARHRGDGAAFGPLQQQAIEIEAGLGRQQSAHQADQPAPHQQQPRLTDELLKGGVAPENLAGTVTDHQAIGDLAEGQLHAGHGATQLPHQG